MKNVGRHLALFERLHLHKDETIKATLPGYVNDPKIMPDQQTNKNVRLGLFVLTDQRVCFIRKGLVLQYFAELSLASIYAQEMSTILAYKRLCLYTQKGGFALNSFEPRDAFSSFVDKLTETARQARIDFAQSKRVKSHTP